MNTNDLIQLSISIVILVALIVSLWGIAHFLRGDFLSRFHSHKIAKREFLTLAASLLLLGILFLRFLNHLGACPPPFDLQIIARCSNAICAEGYRITDETGVLEKAWKGCSYQTISDADSGSLKLIENALNRIGPADSGIFELRKQRHCKKDPSFEQLSSEVTFIFSPTNPLFNEPDKELCGHFFRRSEINASAELSRFREIDDNYDRRLKKRNSLITK